MTHPPSIPDPAAPTVTVWDLPTRLFHWSLVAAVATAAVTGFAEIRGTQGLHVTAGYTVLGLLLFRLVWGFAGPAHARFASFAYRPREVLRYLGSVVRRQPHHHLGHNPAGAMMIFALLATLLLIGLTGLTVLGGEEKQGPLAGFVPYALGHGAGELHEGLALALLALIAGHLAGVAVESWLAGENLARAMIHGRKRLPPGAPPPVSGPTRHGRALSLVAAAVLVGAAGVAGLERFAPVGLPVPPILPVYAQECGACHWAYHPSLLPADSWHRMMAGLKDHFGEDAGLPAATAQPIESYLAAYAAEAWDTKAGNRFRRVSADDPLRITATRAWRRIHDDLPDAVFARKSVGGKGNCNACHQDADTGLFSGRAIRVPAERKEGKA